MSKKALVLVANYPNNNGGVKLMYVHTRNKYYVQHDIDVTVLNFASKKDYVIDQIPVITLATYKKEHKKYDVLVLHAANLRNHYFFLKKYERQFEHLVFFFHGHEVLKLNEVYPEPFSYTKQNNKVKMKLQNYYDDIKLRIWNYYLPKLAYKSDYIFVSKWFYKGFEKYTHLNNQTLKGHVHIINNSVGSVFEKNSYHYKTDKKYDFITIRSYMDDSKYGVDLVDRLARRYPQFMFLMIGKGEYYKVHKVPDNMTWIDRFLRHEEIMDFIDQSRCGLLLTREDTQGVMTCELSVYGIPVITSDIEVCQEICEKLDNVSLISNDIESVDLESVYKDILNKNYFRKSDAYSYKNTVNKEEEIIRGMTS